VGKVNGVAVGEAQPQPKRQPINLDELDEFRQYKSARDKREAELQRQISAMQKELEDARNEMLNLIDDPAARQELKVKRMEAQLAQYRQQEQLNQTRQAIASRWGIPVSVLESASTGPEMTALAMDYLKEQASKAGQEKPEPKPEPDKNDVADVVSTTSGTPPTEQRLTSAKLDEQIENLRKVAQQGGSAGERARIQILKLEAQRGRKGIPSAKI